MPPQRNTFQRRTTPPHPYKRSSAHLFGSSSYYEDSTGSSHPAANFLKSCNAYTVARNFDLAWQNLTQASYSENFDKKLFSTMVNHLIFECFTLRTIVEQALKQPANATVPPLSAHNTLLTIDRRASEVADICKDLRRKVMDESIKPGTPHFVNQFSRLSARHGNLAHFFRGKP